MDPADQALAFQRAAQNVENGNSRRFSCLATYLTVGIEEMTWYQRRADIEVTGIDEVLESGRTDAVPVAIRCQYGSWMKGFKLVADQ